MGKKIRCAVLGAGWWGTFAHIPALQENPDAELIAIQHHDRETADRIARDFQIPVAVTTTEELLSIDGLEAVVISSAPFLHYTQALAALQAGKHVLVEKPMTFTAAQAEELIEMADRKHLQLLISCPWHYTEHARQARKLIQEGELGAIRMISILMTNPIDHLLRGDDMSPTHGTPALPPYLHPSQATYSDAAVAGGGQIYTQVSHVAAYLPFLTGAQATDVFARFHCDGAAVDIYDTLTVRMDNGSIVSIASTGATSLNRRDYQVRVFGTKGILFLELWRGKMELVPLTGEARSFPDLGEDEIYPHKTPAWNLIDSIGDPRRNQSPGRLGLTAMEIVEAACLSAKGGGNIRVASLKRAHTQEV